MERNGDTAEEEGERRWAGEKDQAGVHPSVIRCCSQILKECNRQLSWKQKGKWARQSDIMRKLIDHLLCEKCNVSLRAQGECNCAYHPH